jgi:hypothetical protein
MILVEESFGLAGPAWGHDQTKRACVSNACSDVLLFSSLAGEEMPSSFICFGIIPWYGSPKLPSSFICMWLGLDRWMLARPALPILLSSRHMQMQREA